MADPRRWMLLVAMAVAAGLLLWDRGPAEKAAGAQCLGHGQCLKRERCYVVPAADGFATFGRCVDTCEGDLACPQGFRCETAYQGQGALFPKGARGAGTEVQGVCLQGSRSETR